MTIRRYAEGTAVSKPLSRFKRCPACGERLPRTAEWFFRMARARDGLMARCKACHTEGTYDWRRRNPERYRAALIRRVQKSRARKSE